MNNGIRLTVKTYMEWYHVIAAIFVWMCAKHNSLPLGPIKPSSPSTKEIHDQVV